MRVYKFGGASVADADRIRNVQSIVKEEENLLIVVSAIGKTTNAFELVIEHQLNDEPIEATNQLTQILEGHRLLSKELLQDNSEYLKWINEIERDIAEKFKIQSPNYDFLYDQVVSNGELLSSKLLQLFLAQTMINTEWLDARKVILTDSSHREAKVNWNESSNRINSQVKQGKIYVTQGFIASDTNGNTTTLGREGSDFTAAIFSYSLEAESMTIWKDVPGVLTADPKVLATAKKIDRMSYREAIEMTYYGAKVIHPKTIKPIQNKNIPLFVRPFNNPEEAGTEISNFKKIDYPPVLVFEKNQALISIRTTDFSFIAEDHLSAIFETFTKFKIKVNVMRNSAISFTVCVNNRRDRMPDCIAQLKENFKVKIKEDLSLITIRHYSDSMLAEMKQNKKVLFEERLRDTVQLVVRQN